MERLIDLEIKISEMEGMFVWAELFGNTLPVEIEIGCGKGMFIMCAAKKNPHINYLGIEKSAKYFRILKSRIVKAGSENIRIIHGEASYLIKKFVPYSSVHTYHIYYPDPWPKKRHKKRRLINPVFVTSIVHTLLPQGRLIIATDFKDYFEEVLETLNAADGLETVTCRETNPLTCNPEEALTSYERKYILQGRVIYRAEYRKKSKAK